MDSWYEIAIVFVTAVSGLIIGKRISGLQRISWVLGFSIPCLIITILAVARFNQTLQFIWPVSWLAAGRGRYYILSLAIAMGLTAPLSRLPYKIEKLIVCFLMVMLIGWSSVLPVLYPAFIRESLSNIVTTFDNNGICRQTTGYTCGPAAAVTALGKLGLPANEGEIAILSHATPVTGTLPVELSSALQSRYNSDGLSCRYQRFDSINQLCETGITLAVVREAAMKDHCIVVLEVKDEGVTVADPAAGIELIPTERFEQMWRYCGIVLQRDSAERI